MKSSLLQSLFDEQERRPLSVSELNEKVKGELEWRFASDYLVSNRDYLECGTLRFNGKARFARRF